MLNERLKAAQNVMAELIPTEADIENAIVRSSKLTIAIVEGRQSAKLPITTAQDALDQIASATARLVEARGAIGVAHSALREAKDQIGLRAVGMGDLWECPPNNGSVSPLKTVQAA